VCQLLWCVGCSQVIITHAPLPNGVVCRRSKSKLVGLALEKNLNSLFRAVPKIFEPISSSHRRRPKLASVQICPQSFSSIGYGSQNQLFNVLQWGKWQPGQPMLNEHSIYSASISQAFVFKLYGRKYFGCESYVFKKNIVIPHHSYGPIVNQLLPWAGQMIKALWDRSFFFPFLGGEYPTQGGIGDSSNHVSETMCAGLAVVLQVSFCYNFCWICSSGVVINTLKSS